jgi:hypothetical protein
MPELPVVDKAERERVRHGLKEYKELHGGIGDPELQQRIMYSLGCSDSAVPLSTLQRFIKGSHRTDDLMVRRYAKFLSIVAPPGLADEVGAAISACMLYPVNRTPKPAIEYQGRYELAVHSYGKVASEAGQASRAFGCLMLPARDPRFLTVRTWEIAKPSDDQSGEPIIEYRMGSGLFMPCGLEQYLIMSVAFANAWCSFLTAIDDDPIILQGVMLQTGAPERPSEPAYELRLTQIDGPKMRAKVTGA